MVRHIQYNFSLLNKDDGQKTTVLLNYLLDEASNKAFYLLLKDYTPYDNERDTLMQNIPSIETAEELRTSFEKRFKNNEQTLDHFDMELSVLFSTAYYYRNKA